MAESFYLSASFVRFRIRLELLSAARRRPSRSTSASILTRIRRWLLIHHHVDQR